MARGDAPRKLLEWLRGKISDRKLRLFTSASWRWEGEIARRDNGQEKADLAAAIGYVEAWAEGGTRPEAPFPTGFGWHPLLAQHAGDAANWTVRNKRHYMVVDEVEAAQQQVLLRDIFGNPFRPAPFSPSWRTDTAVSLAKQMYDARDFGAMPIMADALQDAGCDSDDVLSHCRGEGPHVRGCWVVDGVLGLS
jgi:hypothetical protein